MQGTTGSSFAAYGIECTVQKEEKFQFIDVRTPGYTEIQIGNTLEFELKPSSKSVYMTIKNKIKEGDNICKSHEIIRSRNYIINRNGALLDAKKNQKWIDTDGCNHMVTHDDEDALNKKRMELS